MSKDWLNVDPNEREVMEGGRRKSTGLLNVLWKNIVVTEGGRERRNLGMEWMTLRCNSTVE